MGVFEDLWVDGCAHIREEDAWIGEMLEDIICMAFEPYGAIC